jgi:hypothetical protein
MKTDSWIGYAAISILMVGLLAVSGPASPEHVPVATSVASPGTVAQTDETEEGRRTAAIEESSGNLWAAISVRSPIERVFKDRGDSITLYFALVNDGDKPVAPKVKSSKLFINGKIYEDWSRIVSDVGGPGGTRRAKRFDSLSPGDYIVFGYGLKEVFWQPGIYRVRWEGEKFRSPEIMFRVMRTTLADIEYRQRTEFSEP